MPPAAMTHDAGRQCRGHVAELSQRRQMSRVALAWDASRIGPGTEAIDHADNQKSDDDDHRPGHVGTDGCTDKSEKLAGKSDEDNARDDGGNRQGHSTALGAAGPTGWRGQAPVPAQTSPPSGRDSAFVMRLHPDLVGNRTSLSVRQFHSMALRSGPQALVILVSLDGWSSGNSLPRPRV